LEASFDRCCDLKVPVEIERPQKILPKIELASLLANNSLLVTLTEQVITPHQHAGPRKNHIYILCDPELIGLKIFAAPEVMLAAKETGVKPGTVFTEESCGTNALALANEHQRLVAIRGEQHYCRFFKEWWCVAGPVKDPSGNTLGYLDISMHAGKELGLVVAHLQTLANSIERELYLWEVEQKLKQTGARLPPGPALPPEMERVLTLREREVLQLLLSGLGSKEIAAKLHLSITTIEDYRKQIYQKLGVKGGIKGILALLNY
jgi:transcriptional regulator of acetoin/glycerol metabolism